MALPDAGHTHVVRVSMIDGSYHSWCFSLLPQLVQVQTTREHVLVYWAAPLIGSLLAGWTWRALQRNRQQQTKTNAKKIE